MKYLLLVSSVRRGYYITKYANVYLCAQLTCNQITKVALFFSRVWIYIKCESRQVLALNALKLYYGLETAWTFLNCCKVRSRLLYICQHFCDNVLLLICYYRSILSTTLAKNPVPKNGIKVSSFGIWHFRWRIDFITVRIIIRFDFADELKIRG